MYSRTDDDLIEYGLTSIPPQKARPVIIVPVSIRGGKCEGYIALFSQKEADSALKELRRLGFRHIAENAVITAALLKKAEEISRIPGFRNPGKGSKNGTCVVIPAVLKGEDKVRLLAVTDLILSPSLIQKIDWERTLKEQDKKFLSSLLKEDKGFTLFSIQKVYGSEKGKERFVVPLPPSLTTSIVCTKKEKDMVLTAIGEVYGSKAMAKAASMIRRLAPEKKRSELEKGSRVRRLERSHGERRRTQN